MIEAYRELGLVSKKTAREVAGFDHTDEMDQRAQDEKDEPEPVPVVVQPGGENPNQQKIKKAAERRRENKKKAEKAKLKFDD